MRIDGKFLVQVSEQDPLEDSISIEGNDPFVLGVQIVDWLRGHADRLELAMSKDAGTND